VGLAFLGDLARQRSLASAALLFLVLVDEIEGLAFLAIGVLLQRPELFLSTQEVIFPAVLFVAGLASLARNWRRHTAERRAAAPIEAVELSTLNQRIGTSMRERASA
jgi:positive regulator of sigma E activity